MAISRPFLTALAVWLLLPGADALAAKVLCLGCHSPHYQAMGSCVGCHRGDPRSDRIRIAHHGLISARFSWYSIPGSLPVQRGDKLLENFACRRCHTTAGKGNKLASDLDRLPAGTTPQEMFAAIESPALLMPEFRLEEGEITDLVNAILAGAKPSGQKGKETPQVVHFEAAKGGVENIFEKKCGACHKVLTKALGALGKGNIGPNLSGLLTDFYPATSGEKSRWTADSLEKWLKNPRKDRPVTRMRPVPLEKGELQDLLNVFTAIP